MSVVAIEQTGDEVEVAGAGVEVPEHDRRPEAEGGVTQPTEAVVELTLATGRLRQARRRRRHRRSGRRVAQGTEHVQGVGRP